MNQFSPTVETIDFPALTLSSAENLKFRAFGTEREDLSIDFAENDTPTLVTQILTSCAVGKTADFFWNLSIGKRLECLLRLVSGGETESFSFPFKCGSCASELELELTLDEIAEQQNQSDRNETVEIIVGGEQIKFRKPLGIDQKSWQTIGVADERSTARKIIQSLKVSDKEFADWDDEVFGLIDEAMDEADPLVNFNCRVVCGDCGAANEFETDLCEFALGELRRKQWRLLYSVHRLAARYHWSESDIFAVPHWRRLQYLALISEEKSR